jgi:anti-sigma B factor antagonist
MGSPGSSIVVAVIDGVSYVGGEIDLKTAPELDAILGAVHGEVHIDMSGVTFADSVGPSVLITHRRRHLSQGTARRVVAMSQPVRRLLEITGLRPILTEGLALPA